MMPTHLHNKAKSRRKRPKLPFGAARLLSALEGIEGGFAVSTGIVAGLSFASITSRRVLLITAGVSILVNGFNAAAVKYASEHYQDELDGHEKKHAFRTYFSVAAIEFVLYLLICGITLIPLILLSQHIKAVIWCTVLTLVVLYIAGLWKGTLLHKHPVRDGIELAAIGLLIIGVGATAGFLLSR